MNVLDSVRGFMNAPISLNHFLALAAIMFVIGLFGVLTRRNLIAVLMSIEILLNASALAFVSVAAYTDPNFLQGHLFALFIIAVAAAEVAVGLAIFINVFRTKGGVTTDDLMEMRT